MAWWSSSKPKAGSSIDQAQPALPFQEDPPQVPEAAVAEPVVSLNDKLPLDTAAPEAVSAIQDACGAVEAAALAAARDDSIYPARWFIDAILAVHEQGQLPWWVHSNKLLHCDHPSESGSVQARRQQSDTQGSQVSAV
jgi:hypothetical protein